MGTRTKARRPMINARAKGHSFERKIATRLRKKWPHLKQFIRRGNQSHKAREPDIVFDPGPRRHPHLWIECHHGRTDPRKKYAQAKRDADRSCATSCPLPVVIYKPNGSRRCFVMVEVGEQAIQHFETNTKPLLAILDFEEWLASLSPFKPTKGDA